MYIPHPLEEITQILVIIQLKDKNLTTHIVYLSLLLTRSHVIFSMSLLSSNPTTVAAIRGGSGAGAGCSLIGSEQTTSLVPYNCKIIKGRTSDKIMYP